MKPFIALLILSSLVYPIQKHRTSEYAKQNQKNTGGQAIPNPPTPIPTATGQQKSANNESFAKRHGWNYYDAIAPQTWPSWLLGVVGIGGIIAALLTLCSIQRQTRSIHHQAVHARKQTRILKESADAAWKSAEAAKESAGATRLNVEALVNTERALIEIDLMEPGTEIDEETGESAIDYAKEFQYGIRATNHGRTVARIVSYKVWHDSFTKNFGREKFSNSMQVTRHIILGTNKSTPIGNIDIDAMFSNEEWPSIQEGKKTAMVRIDIHYEDVIQGGGHERIQSIHMRPLRTSKLGQPRHAYPSACSV